jgi:hypothetical protein
MNFSEKLDSNYYRSQLPYPAWKDPNRTKLVEAYREDEARLNAEFKADLFEYHGVTGHPKADLAFRIAYDREHSAGHGDVASLFGDLAELLK